MSSLFTSFAVSVRAIRDSPGVIKAINLFWLTFKKDKGMVAWSEYR